MMYVCMYVCSIYMNVCIGERGRGGGASADGDGRRSAGGVVYRNINFWLQLFTKQVSNMLIENFKLVLIY